MTGADGDAGASAYYGSDLALVHHRGYGFHAAACAPGVLALIEPVRERGGVVLELGCGSGRLTRSLISAGHRVIATDASRAMLELARSEVGDGVHELRRLTLPDDPLPPADAIVAVGHPVSYLPDAAAIERALIAIAGALRPGGLLAMDICDLEWGRARAGEVGPVGQGRVGPDWAIITRFSMPSADRFDRDITTFVPDGAEGGGWRRHDEHHENTLIDTSLVPSLLRAHGVEARVGDAFGAETLPPGLRVVVGHRAA